MPDHGAWRSPPPQQTPLVEPGSLPTPSPLHAPLSPAAQSKDVLHPSFLPPCEHSKSDGDMHAHAFDLLSLSGASPVPTRAQLPQPSPTTVPSSVPAHPTSVLSATRPPPPASGNSASPAGSAPKARRMSSSTTGVLGRGKLGATGESTLGLGGVGRDARPTLSSFGTSYTSTAPVPNRRPSNVGANGNGSPGPALFDFAKTDARRPPNRSSVSSSAVNGHAAVPASLPVRSHLLANARNINPPIVDDIELDMAFDAEDEDEDDEEGSGRSGSAELEMELDDEDDGEVKPEWKKLALGTGSGGVKGRRKGMVFKCENCAKEYRHPSCLIKHRWEHSPHWKEPTALSMSKHQQVQMLEAAAILAHLAPNGGKALPNDKSLWPAVLSPPGSEPMKLRRASTASRDPSNLRSPSISNAPLTPSSLREASTLSSNAKIRKTSPDSDSTTSSIGEGYPQQPIATNGNGHQNGHSNGTNGHARPVGIGSARTSSYSSNNGPRTPQSVGSLPTELAGLHFQPGTPSHMGASPIPNRNMPLSLKARAGLVGGGMFGAINTSVPNSSVRSGVLGDDEDEDDSRAAGRRGKSSSEEADERRKGREGEEWGMAMEMEL